MSSFAFVRVVPIRIYLASSSRMEYAWRLPILSNTSVATPLFSSSSSYNSAIWSCGCSPSVLFMLSITWAVSFSRRSRVVLSSRSTVFLYTAVRQQQLQRQGRMHARPVSKMYVRCADHCGRQPANSQLASALTQSQASWGKGPAGNDVALPAWVTALDAASTLHVVNDSSLALDRFVGGSPSDLQTTWLRGARTILCDGKPLQAGAICGSPVCSTLHTHLGASDALHCSSEGARRNIQCLVKACPAGACPGLLFTDVQYQVFSVSRCIISSTNSFALSSPALMGAS